MVARNAYGLHRAWSAGDSRRERNIADQAKDYLLVAQSHPHLFRKPKVIFEFLAGVPDRLAEDLRLQGVEVKGEIVSSDTLPKWMGDSSSEEEEEEESDDESEAEIGGFEVPGIVVR